ncbi:MAG: PEP-CTERM sorting domain-containing protein [Coleofasciculus sp. C1-SOL-03]|uniref:PEP-CTERM sorting domain-containing protein n=1 Tax=Coleofasciculus sp. C1-SOL-03 TaxID=3069522 RepID=UPI0032FBC921
MKFSSLVPSVLAATGAAVAMSSFNPADAAFVTFSATPFTGNDAEVDFLLEEVGNDVKFTVTVDSNVNGGGDLRGVWFDIANDSLLDLDIDKMGSNIPEIQQNAGSVSDLGGDANLNGGGPNNPGNFDIGVEIGTQGASPDFIPSTMFTVKNIGLDQFLGQKFAARVTSVGSDGEGSSKLSAVAPTEAEPVPEPLTILGSATALGIGGLLKRQQSKKNNKA